MVDRLSFGRRFRISSLIHPALICCGDDVVRPALRAAGGFGVYVKPLEAEFGWSRGSISGVAALSLLLLGAVGPFAGRLADRWGPRRVTLLAVVLLGGGAIGASAVQTLWHAYLTTGILMGIGSGGLGLATGSVIAARWFESRRGLAIGVAAGGMSAGSSSSFDRHRDEAVVRLARELSPLGSVPRRRATSPSGESARSADRVFSATARPPALRARWSARSLDPRASKRHSTRVWLLAVPSFVCGYRRSGLLLTHFVPHSLEHNFRRSRRRPRWPSWARERRGALGSGFLCIASAAAPAGHVLPDPRLSMVFLLYVNAPSLHHVRPLRLNWVRPSRRRDAAASI